MLVSLNIQRNSFKHECSAGYKEAERNFKCLLGLRHAELWCICLVTLSETQTAEVPTLNKLNKFSPGGGVRVCGSKGVRGVRVCMCV